MIIYIYIDIRISSSTFSEKRRKTTFSDKNFRRARVAAKLGCEASSVLLVAWGMEKLATAATYREQIYLKVKIDGIPITKR